jgi:LacI family transcriptional regulator
VGTVNRRPTLADVAELSGMSKSAASMILNNRPGSRLSVDAAERVRAAAAELGYKPNPAAQSLRLGKTRTIGFISDQVIITRYASGMIQGVLQTAETFDYTVLISETGGHPGQIERAVEAMADRRVDGIVVGLMAARLVDVPHPPSIPLVIANGRTPDSLPCILPDEYVAGRGVADILVRAGHRHIGIVGDLPLEAIANPRRTATIGIRFKGIYDVLGEAGITPIRATVTQWHPTVGFEQARRLLGEHPEITALLASNDNMAFGIYQALSEMHIRIPEDVSVISFDDEEFAAYLRPGLTTARLPYDEMARLAVEQILGRRELGEELIPMPIIMRQSVGPAA